MNGTLGETQEDFLRKVNADIRDAGSPEFAAALRSPEGVEIWAATLKKMKRNTESQLSNDQAERSEMRASCLRAETDEEVEAAKQDWIEFVATRDRWRADAIRFKNGVENKLDEAMMLIRQYDKDNPVFRKAVAAHHQAVVYGSDSEASLADEVLWSML